MIIRRATLEDLPELITLRIDFLRTMDGMTEEQEKDIREKLVLYYNEHLDRDLIIAVAETAQSTIVSTAFLVLSERPPSPSFITGRIGTLLNVYTDPENRRIGLASKTVKFIIEEAKGLNVSLIDLNATPEGKPLYVKQGFQEVHYSGMRLMLL